MQKFTNRRKNKRNKMDNKGQLSSSTIRMFNVPNLLTAANLLGGFFSIIATLSGRLDLACLALLLSAIFDFFDGMAARVLQQHSPLGKQLDSLADMVSFGIAPGMLMFVMIILGVDQTGLKIQENGLRLFQGDIDTYPEIQILAWVRAFFYNEPNYFDATIKWLPFTAMIIPFFAMFRLAKFNIDERQTDKFIGVPTPLATIFFIFFPLYFSTELPNWGYKSDYVRQIFDCYSLVGIVVLFSILMVANVPLIALKFKNLTWKDNKFRYTLIGLSLLSIVIFRLWSIPIIVTLYLILSIIENSQIKKNEI